MKPFPIFLLIAVSVSGATSSPALEINPALLDQLVAEARGQNPALEAAAVRVQAANASVGSVRTWDDPTASFGIWASGPGGFGASEQGNLVYGLDQKLPLQNRPQLARKVAEADAERERFAADFEGLKLRRELTLGLLNLALASRKADLAEADLAWLETTAASVDHRYRVGQASQVDWLKAQTAAALASNDLTTERAERDHAWFSVNRLLNRELHAPWPDIAVPALRPSVGYTPELIAAALDSEPWLRVLRQENVSAQAMADLTHQARLPDVRVGLQAWQYSGNGSLKQAMATVSFSVPWFNRRKYDSDWKRDQERKRASVLEAEDYSLSIREELHHHVIDLDTARRQAVLYQGQLIPLAEQTLASAQIAWEHGLGSFQEILDAHRLLVADQLGLAQSLTEQGSLLAGLCFLTGSRDPATVVSLGRSEPIHTDNTPPVP
ncbi:MAG TPA: TolC family protein [Opitutaceae bacterium]|jgi:outer membrane protein TolC